MPESKLTLDLYDLEAEVGDHAGFGLGERFGDTNWTDAQLNRIGRSVASGVRNVYWTQEMEGVPARYEWSWLRPTSRLTLASGESSLALPADYNGMLADVIPASGSGEVFYPVPVVGLGEVYGARSASPDQTGRPLMFYVEPVKGTAHHHSSRYTLQAFPEADQDYTLRVFYEVAPDALTASFPFIYGGPALSETFKAAVRAAYSETFEPDTALALATQAKFVEKLRAAIAGDRKHKPLTVGPNLDRSDSPYSDRNLSHGDWGVPLYVNGVAY